MSFDKTSLDQVLVSIVEDSNNAIEDCNIENENVDDDLELEESDELL